MFRTTILRTALLATALPLVWIASNLQAASTDPDRVPAFGVEAIAKRLHGGQFFVELTVTDLEEQSVISHPKMLVRPDMLAEFDEPDGRNRGINVSARVMIHPDQQFAEIEVTLSRYKPIARYRTRITLAGESDPNAGY